MLQKLLKWIKKYFWVFFLGNMFTQTLLLFIVPSLMVNTAGWIMMFAMSIAYQLILVYWFGPGGKYDKP